MAKIVERMLSDERVTGLPWTEGLTRTEDLLRLEELTRTEEGPLLRESSLFQDQLWEEGGRSGGCKGQVSELSF